VIAVKNEAGNIQDCLETVKWAGEIIIIDNNSTDNTLDLARAYTDKIYSCDGGPYGFVPYLQNAGIEKATGEWILVLDADERVPEETKKEILEKINRSGYDGYMLKHQTHMSGIALKSPYWTFEIMKLFRKEKGVFDCNRTHAPIVISGKIGKINSPLLHLSMPDLQTYIRKINLYSSQDAKYIFEHKRGGLLNRKIKKINFYNLFFEPALLFVYVYVLKGSFKDGRRGLILSAMMMFYLFLERAKVWELTIGANKIGKSNKGAGPE